MFFGNKESPVGAVIAAMLTETQFQQQCGPEWVLADGRSATGTRYNSITGSSTIPDLRGVFLRGKNNSRSDGNQDPAGEQTLGTYESDQNKAHTHFTVYDGIENTSFGTGTPIAKQRTGSTADANYNLGGQTNTANIGLTTSDGGNDSRPRSVVINWFIKIN
jgi:hypothetical protein